MQLNFTDGLLEVHGGCNWRSGSYYQVEDVFYWCDKEGTSIGCRPDLAVQDYWLASWLASGVRIRKNSHQLVMQGSGVEVSFRPLGLDSIL